MSPAGATCDGTNADIDVRGGVRVEEGATFVLGSEEGTGGGTIRGGVRANAPASLQLHFAHVYGGVKMLGGNGFFSTVEDNNIHGGATINGYSGFWLGFIRNTVHGSVQLNNNRMDDPDANEFVTNTIQGNLVCHNNSPAPQVGDSARVCQTWCPGRRSISALACDHRRVVGPRRSSERQVLGWHPPLRRWILGGRCRRRTWRSFGRRMTHSSAATLRLSRNFKGPPSSGRPALRTPTRPPTGEGSRSGVTSRGTWRRFPGLRADLEECVEAPGDRVLATVRYTGRARASGIDMDWRQWLVYTFKEGLIVRAEEYFDREQALEAAGLRE